MIYARAHDQTVAEDYFSAMARVEERLEIVPPKQEETRNEVINVPETTQILDCINLLALPELGQNERLEIAESLKQALFPGILVLHPPPVMAEIAL